ncbi:hypothetical protein PENTCL1PPCAC_20509, partial [Pristionchus entomophagus]
TIPRVEDATISKPPRRSSNRISAKLPRAALLQVKKEEVVEKTPMRYPRPALLQIKKEEVVEKEECSICYVALSRAAVRLNCGHLFHQGCIVRWLSDKTNEQQTCAMCREHTTEIRRVSNNKKIALPPAADPLNDSFTSMVEYARNMGYAIEFA